ncbi:MAG: response regulator [Desulfobacterales bacterium]|jgi:DNA-binding NtrC family response regulator
MGGKNSIRSNHIKILLIDDEVAYVNVLSNRLSKRNFYVAKAFSGTEAIQILRRQDFDIAVLDLKMEDMDGIEVLKILKKMDPRIAVIMLTGHGSAEAAREGIEHGAFDYLTKPCELDALITKINDAYRKRNNV